MLDLDAQSLSVRLAELGPEERAEVLEGIDPATLSALVGTWAFERRKNQTPPSTPYFILALKGGRGSGKTRTATEEVTKRIEEGSTWLHLLGRTHYDVRDTMIRGESGLIEVANAHGIEAVYESSKRRLWYPDYKAQALILGAHEPDECRGPQCETAWADEFSVYPRKVDRVGNTAFTNLIFGCRLGNDPRVIVSFTPRTSPPVKALIDRGRDPKDGRVALLEMSLLDNIANLPQTFIDEVVGTFRGTRLEAQEIYGEYLDAVEGALWSPELLDRCRVDDHPLLDVVEVGVDPPGEAIAECGIVVGGLEANAERKRAFVIADYSMKGPPEEWARKAVQAYYLHGARAIVAETNQGHDMVRACVHAVDPDVKVRKVNAHESKRARAEPIELLYEGGRVFHVGSPLQFVALEGQMTGWDPNDKEAPSPDRMDAAVWVLTSLFGLMNRRKGSVSQASSLRIPEIGGGRFGR